MKILTKIIGILLIIAIFAVTIFILFTPDSREVSPNLSDFNYLNVYPDWLENQPPHNISQLNSIDSVTKKAIYLFRQACYNEKDTEKFVYFLDGGGGSVFLGANITMRAQTTSVHDGDDLFHQMINIVTEAETSETLVKTFLSRSYQKIYYDNKKYYRRGANPAFDEEDILVAAWSNFEISDNDPRTPPDTIDNEYLNHRYNTKTALDFGQYTLEPNNFNSDNLVLEEGTTIELKQNEQGHAYYAVTMMIDTEVANSNPDTIETLKKETNANPVSYSNFILEFEVWDNGLFKYLNPIESWSGTIKMGLSFSGESNLANPRYYSYHPDDCDLTRFIDAYINNENNLEEQ
ncbi:MAG: hypothetical protein ACOCWI_04200 [Bacillota bacterium]